MAMTGFEDQRDVVERKPAQPQPPLLATIEIYRTEAGIWQLTDAPGRFAVEAMLTQGYFVGENRDGLPCILDSSNTFAISADDALREGVLQVRSLSASSKHHCP